MSQKRILIGRFQLPTIVHFELIEQADIVLIGSASTSDERNPFTYEQRKQMIESSIKTPKIIYPLHDCPGNDILWKQHVEELVYRHTLKPVLLGNNKDVTSYYLVELFKEWDWRPSGISTNAGYIINSTDLRSLYRQQKWDELAAYTSPEVIKILQSYGNN